MPNTETIPAYMAYMCTLCICVLCVYVYIYTLIVSLIGIIQIQCLKIGDNLTHGPLLKGSKCGLKYFMCACVVHRISFISFSYTSCY